MELGKKRVKEEEVILIRLYEIPESTSSTTTLATTKLSFINNEVDNLMKYMKFIQSLT